MDLFTLIIWIIGIILAVKIAIFVVKGAFKLAIIMGIIALVFYLFTNLNVLSMI